MVSRCAVSLEEYSGAMGTLQAIPAMSTETLPIEPATFLAFSDSSGMSLPTQITKWFKS